MPRVGDAWNVTVRRPTKGRPVPAHRSASIDDARGFTLIEMLIVLTIIGVLLAVAVPSYLGYRTRANDTAAKSTLRAASTAAEAYRQDNLGHAGDADNNASTSGYQGLTTARMRTYDRGIQTALTVYATKTNVTTYCIRITLNGRAWSVLGPGHNAASYKNNTTCT
jgi:type IV pilus assembly protein PilA